MVKYGITWPAHLTEWQIELALFCVGDVLEKKHPTLRKLERYQHFIHAAEILYGKDSERHFIWHPWAVTMIQDFCKYNTVSVAGPGSSGKSELAGLWVWLNFLCDPLHATGIVTSTTVNSARGKIWKSIERFYLAAPAYIRKIVLIRDTPLPAIYVKFNGKILSGVGILLVPSNANKKSADIRGFKSEGSLCCVIDEHSDLGNTFSDTILSNLRTNLYNVHIISLSNPIGYTDPFSRLAEPLGGFDSVTVEDEGWVTKIGGWCRHFDGLKSPNAIARKNLWPIANWDIAEELKITHGENSPKYWRDIRAFWCPEGDTINIYTEQEIINAKADVPYNWMGIPSTMYVGVDPAYTAGGDRCALVFCRVQNLPTTIIDVLTPVVIPVRVGDDFKTKEEYLAEAIIRECTRNNVTADRMGIDVTGGGDNFASIISMLWKRNDFLRVKFSGKASTLPVTDMDPTPSDQVYSNRVTELWYYGKHLIRHRMLHGMSKDLIDELTNRRYITSRITGNTRVTAESKQEMRARTNKSPDLGDAWAICLETIRTRTSVISPKPILVKGGSVTGDLDEYNKFAVRVNNVYSNNGFDSLGDLEGKYLELP